MFFIKRGKSTEPFLDKPAKDICKLKYVYRRKKRERGMIKVIESEGVRRGSVEKV